MRHLRASVRLIKAVSGNCPVAVIRRADDGDASGIVVRRIEIKDVAIRNNIVVVRNAEEIAGRDRDGWRSSLLSPMSQWSMTLLSFPVEVGDPAANTTTPVLKLVDAPRSDAYSITLCVESLSASPRLPISPVF